MGRKKGFIVSQETKNKISQKLKGIKPKNFDTLFTPEINKKRNESLKGRVGYWKDKKMSLKTKRKMSIIQSGKNNAFYGKIHTKETREKLKKSHIGYIMPEEQKKNISKANKKVIHTPEWNRKVSEANKGRKLSQEHIQNSKSGRLKSDKARGENHYNWQGGKSFGLYSIEFNKELKEQVRKRDNYRCQECFRHQDELYNKKGRKYKLHIHHIDYNKKNNRLKNLISLCRGCHIQTNFKRNDWIKYFKRKVQFEPLLFEDY